jgi:hypothetical protein
LKNAEIKNKKAEKLQHGKKIIIRKSSRRRYPLL